MGLHEILSQIDREISQLKQARAMLEGGPAASSGITPKKRNLTPEGRKRIVEAVRRRWALERSNKLAESAGGWVTKSQSTANLTYHSSQL